MILINSILILGLPMSIVEKMLHFQVSMQNLLILRFLQIFILKRQIDTSISITHRHTLTILNGRQLIAKLCELVGYVHRHQNEIKSWFLNREYPKTFLDTEVTKLNSLILLEIKKLTQTEFLQLLPTTHCSNDKVKKAFTPGPMWSFRERET